MTEEIQYLRTVSDLVSFTKDVLQSLTEAGPKVKYFAPLAFIVVTQDPETGEVLKGPMAVPLSVDLVVGELTAEEIELVNTIFKSSFSFLRACVERVIKVGKATAVLTVTAGSTTSVSVDKLSGEVVENNIPRKSVMATLRSSLCSTRSWVADLEETKEGELISIGSFTEIDNNPDDGLAPDFHTVN